VTAGGGLACIGAATAGDGSACGGVATAGDGSACGRAAAAGDGVGGAAGSCRGVATFLDSSSSIPSPTGRQPSLALSDGRASLSASSRESTGHCSGRHPVSHFIRWE
jgi:hypothetical protein